MITNYGYDNFFPMLLAAIFLIVTGLLTQNTITASTSYFVGFLLLAFTLWFFRDPTRTLPADALQNEALVIAPADGKIMGITPIEDDTIINGKALQITIFLSPLDVHVNRVPVSGTILFSEYKVGKFYAAYEDRASLENEQTVIGLQNSKGKIVFKQMVGVLARRIVNTLQPGQKVVSGEKFGMMKFGSRMDVIVPANAEVHITKGQRVRGAETILATLQ